jgi:hypothetical protein
MHFGSSTYMQPNICSYRVNVRSGSRQDGAHNQSNGKRWNNHHNVHLFVAYMFITTNINLVIFSSINKLTQPTKQVHLHNTFISRSRPRHAMMSLNTTIDDMGGREDISGAHRTVCVESSAKWTLESCSTGLPDVHRTVWPKVSSNFFQRLAVAALNGRLTWLGHQTCTVCTGLSGAPVDRTISFLSNGYI